MPPLSEERHPSQKRVFVDFMKTDGKRRLELSTQGTREDLERLGIQLEEGLHLAAYSDDVGDSGVRNDLLVDGIVHQDELGRWVLEIDWNAIRHER